MSLIALFLTPLAAQASPAEPVCIRAGDLPPALRGWYGRVAERPVVGQPFFVTKGDQPPARMIPIARGEHGPAQAEVLVAIPRAGQYRVVLSDGAWIDLVADGRPLVSTGHAHGPICTGIRKMVDFRLRPGSYRLQLGEMKTPRIKVMIVRAPGVR